ncbi:carboxypeptidase-like regulatory domain-containing protein [Hymenobacter ginkgonis]|uniref:carboxypeptidase-like regulatory domain-containing protein n=1 Tax=Hymenobacter ginkgonis TaxID=2682976 RepID=UPI0018DE496B|nr:carboxypeptidase-like regulatory domain-containing protein [Hymenobacter ginkgonis]
MPRLAAAQERLAGVVQDSVTHAPLAFASVFLANTTLGATTTEDGKFEFPRVPAGTYDVVASYVGYRLAKQTITVGATAPPLVLRLSPSANRLGEVVVRAHRTRTDDYQRFVQLFLGNTTFSKQCHIRNRSDVQAYFDAYNRELTATVDNFLQVDNQALGYRIKYFGFNFKCDFRQQTLSFYGQPVFEEMTPRDDRQQRQWEANRVAAYHGSLTHFLKSVYDNRLSAEGFLAQKVRIVRNPRYALADSLMQALRASHTSYSAAYQDSMDRWRQVPPAFALLYTAERPADSLRRVSADGAHTLLRFTDELQVCYFGEAPDPRYGQPMAALGPPGAPAPAKRQVSRLRLLAPEAEIQPNGYLVNPLAVFVSEYWGFEKIGEFLPLNYVPPASPSPTP